MKTIAIIGHGFVGKAVEHGFGHHNLRIFDTKYNTPFPEITQSDIDATFVCVPTPMGPNGAIDSSIVENCVDLARKYTTGLILLKSTVTPDVVKKLTYPGDPRFVYNPEFLTERNALADFVNAPFHIFGGSQEAYASAVELYDQSLCAAYPGYEQRFHVTALEASYIKYALNSFLATKILWFNQFEQIVSSENLKSDYSEFVNYDRIREVIGADPRMGTSHMQVPGPDGKYGFGGACFPKDVAAFLKYAPYFSVLQEVQKVNNSIRSQYQKDAREVEQHVNFEITKDI